MPFTHAIGMGVYRILNIEEQMKTGTHCKRTDKRKGTTCLLAALSVHEGYVEARCIDSANDVNFLKHLYRSNPGREMYIIADNLSAHKHENALKWVAKRRRLRLHFTPAYVFWLNQIEIGFNIFTRGVPKGGVWRSKQALVTQIMRYIRQYNEQSAHPFKWTYEGKSLSA